jgi:LAO/AO transport system kinase
MGDDVQAMKAGLAEIADIFVVNKADLPGADVTLQELRALFCSAVIVPTSAITGDGVAQLVDAVEKHRELSMRNGDYRKKRLQLCREELLFLLRQRLMRQLQQRIDGATLDRTAQRVAAGHGDPYSEAEALAKKLGL